MEAGHFIDGQSVCRGQTKTLYNPARHREAVGAVYLGGEAEVEAALASCQTAFPAWAGLGPGERAQRLQAARQTLAAALPELATLLVRENGKTLGQAERELRRCLETLDRVAGFAPWLADEETHRSQGRQLTIRREPLGIVVAISPWNHPVGLTIKRVAPALLAGNTVIVKPPAVCPLTVTRAIALLAATLPPGVLNLVNGPGGRGGGPPPPPPPTGGGGVTARPRPGLPTLPTGRGGGAGAQRAADPRVRMIALTGGTVTGKQVMADSAPSLKRLSLELGGNDPAIVLPDQSATPELARGLVKNAFNEAGQICFAIKRVYVHRSQHDALLEQLAGVLDEWLVGDGLDPRTSMGPVQNRDQWQLVVQLAEDAAARGAQLRPCGRPVPGTDWEGGYFCLPTLVSQVRADALVVAEEQFGPILPVLAYDSVEDAIAAANATPFGLRSSVWTSDQARGMAVAARIRAGVTSINEHAVLPREWNFIGLSDSGLGRDSIMAGLDEYVHAHAVVTNVQ